MREKSTLLLLIFFIAISEIETTTCFVQNSILGTFTQTCSANIYQCMKFTCKLSSPKKFEQVTKGCNDPSNPPISCTTIMTNCQAQGGVGQCYTCTGDYCNSSPLRDIFTATLFLTSMYIF